MCRLSARDRLLLHDGDGEDEVAGADVVNHIQALDNLAEAGVNSVEVLGVLAVVADEKLRATRIFAPMGHRKHTPVVVLTRR